MRNTKFIVIALLSIILLPTFFTGVVQGSYPSGDNEVSAVSSRGDLYTEFKEGVLTVDIKDVALKEVLKQLSDQNDIIFLLPPSLGEEKVMVRFTEYEVDRGLNKILSSYNRIFYYQENSHASQPSSPRLTEVRIFPSAHEGKAAKEPVMKISAGTSLSPETGGKETKAHVPTSLKNDEESYEELSQVFKKVGNRLEKLKTIERLKEVGDVESIKALSLAIYDRDPKVKEGAVTALQNIAKDTIVDEGGEETSGNDKVPDPAEKREGNATLNLAPISGNSESVELSNDIPVRGVQFTLNGAKVSEVRTTPRTEGFLVKEKNGKVIMISLSGKTIAPGNGPIAEVDHHGGSSYISGITIGK